MRGFRRGRFGGLAIAAALIALAFTACQSERGDDRSSSEPASMAAPSVATDSPTAGDAHAAASTDEHDQTAPAGEGQEEAKMITDGSHVSIEYTLTLADGTVVDTNKGQDPLTYTQGGGQILPALEKELAGLKVSDSKNVKLSAADGYGEIDPKAFQEVEIDRIPEDARKVGALLVAGGPGGEQRPIRVAEVHEDKVLLDFNHPLAGQALVFDVTIVGVD